MSHPTIKHDERLRRIVMVKDYQHGNHEASVRRMAGTMQVVACGAVLVHHLIIYCTTKHTGTLGRTRVVATVKVYETRDLQWSDLVFAEILQAV